MNNSKSQPSLSQTVEIMEEVDRRRHVDAEAINHEAWIDEIKDTYEAQGVVVDENLIRTVIAEREKNAIALHEPSIFAQLMLKAYMARRRIAIASGAALLALSLSGIGVYAVNQATLSSSANKLAFVEAAHKDARQWLIAKQNEWSSKNLPAPIQKVAPHVLEKLSSLEVVLSTIEPAPAVDNRDAVVSFYDKAQSTNEQIGRIKAEVINLEGVARSMWDFDRWMAQTSAPTRPWIADRWASLQADRQKNIELGQWAAVATNQDNARSLVEAQALLEDSEKMLAQWPSSQKEEATKLITSAESAWKAMDVTAARALHQGMKDKDVALNQQYTLKVVSGPDVRSGVWRYYDNDQNRKSFYIIVEAIDAAGNAVVLPITNEENGQMKKTSTFGVRVPEKVYNAVRDDKTDNGIVDNNIFATKRSGTFDVSYEYDVSGGTITEW